MQLCLMCNRVRIKPGALRMLRFKTNGSGHREETWAQPFDPEKLVREVSYGLCPQCVKEKTTPVLIGP